MTTLHLRAQEPLVKMKQVNQTKYFNALYYHIYQGLEASGALSIAKERGTGTVGQNKILYPKNGINSLSKKIK